MQTTETVPCKWCGTPTRMTGTKCCDRCWELSTRIRGDVDLARHMMPTTLHYSDELLMQDKYSYLASAWLAAAHTGDYRTRDQVETTICDTLVADKFIADNSRYYIEGGCVEFDLIHVHVSNELQEFWIEIEPVSGTIEQC